MLTDWKREHFIRSVLKKLSRQRVAVLLQPGDVWVIEKAVNVDDDDVKEALRTCHMRGWVEPLSNSVPRGALTRLDSCRRVRCSRAIVLCIV
jgi:hypothetical protein